MLATVADLAAIGALRVNDASYDARVERGNRLLEMASAQVVTYLRYADEDALTAALTATQLTALAGVVAEAAGARLNVSAAPSSEFVPDAASSIMLNRWHMRTIDQIVASSVRGSTSITIERDEDSSYLGAVSLTDEYLGWSSL